MLTLIVDILLARLELVYGKFSECLGSNVYYMFILYFIFRPV